MNIIFFDYQSDEYSLGDVRVSYYTPRCSHISVIAQQKHEILLGMKTNIKQINF